MNFIARVDSIVGHVLRTLLALPLVFACKIGGIRKYSVIFFPSCLPLTFQGDKAARAKGTVLLKPKLMMACILLVSSFKTQGIGPSSGVRRELQSPVLHLHASLKLSL